MRGITLKTMLLIILICILAGMVLALSNPDVISAAVGMLQPAVTFELATAEPATEMPATARPANTKYLSSRSTAANKSIVTAEPKSQYYSDVETVYISPQKNHWTYQSQTLYIDIQKKVTSKPTLLIYYVAEIRTTNPKLLFPCYAGNDRSGKVKMLPAQIAAKRKVLFAVASDCCTPSKQKGIVIRGGVLQYDKMKADTLAVLPDGTLKIYTPKQIAPASLIAKGVKNTFSCGPTLIKNGVVNANLAKDKLFARSARTGVGMITPGHYIFIVVDGCDSKYSVGVTLSEFTAMFRKLSCKQAYNLDGDQSAAMCFMGRQLNGMPGQTSDTQKKVSDLLGIGTSDLVALK